MPPQIRVSSKAERKRADALLSGKWVDSVLDSGYLPHPVIRIGIRRLLAQRLREIASTSVQDAYASKMKYVNLLRTRPIAIETAKANEQHYEVGTGVLGGMLGPRMKYSACLYEGGVGGLGEAEVRMLELYVERAQLRDGMSVLDLGYVLSCLLLLFSFLFCSTIHYTTLHVLTRRHTAAAGAPPPSSSPSASPTQP